MESKKIVGMGESVYDVLFRNSQPQAAVPGGSTFNAMVSLGRTIGVRYPEVPIVMVTQVGDDYVADVVSEFMEKNHMDTSGVVRRPSSQSTVSMAFLDEKNDAHYEFFRDGRDDPSLFRDIEFHEGDLLIFGSFFAVTPSLRDYVRRQLNAAREAGAIIYYDINFRKNHLAQLSETLGSVLENCAMSDFVRGSSEDITYLFGSDDAARVYAENMSSLCRNFICTRGAGPVELFSPDCHTSVDSLKVEKVVSTVGAGDNFNAGFVYGLFTSGIGRDRVENMDVDTWKTLALTAGKFSAHVCQSMFNYVDEDFVNGL